MAPRKSDPTRTRKVLVVTYADGTTDQLNPNRPALLIAFELEHGVQQPETHQQIAWLCWHGLGRPKGSLEAWLEDVEEIDADQVPVGKVRS